jgi:hypothetical protein
MPCAKSNGPAGPHAFCHAAGCEARAPEDQPVAGTTRRRLLKAAGGLVAATVGAGVYARWIEPTWIETVALDLPVPRLPAGWDGVRVGLVADLHHGRRVPLEYLAGGIDRLASLEPDLVAVVGDFVTHGGRVYAEAVAGLMGRLSPPLGVFACLGNHDYGVTHRVSHAEAQEVAGTLPAAGVRLLRNEAVRLERRGEALWIAGTEDFWSGRLRAADTFAQVPSGAAHLALCHNPDAAEDLAGAGAAAILSGHTHGGQVQVPLVGPPILPVRHRDRYEGLHRVGAAWLYINRGLGWLRKVRFGCRPEITILTLRQTEASGAGGASGSPG